MSRLLEVGDGGNIHAASGGSRRLIQRTEHEEVVLVAIDQQDRRIHEASGLSEAGGALTRPVQSTPKRYTVRDTYSSPGRSTVDGKPGWLGESGKCWVSRQKPERRS